MGPCGLYRGTRKICTLVLPTNLARSASWAPSAPNARLDIVFSFISASPLGTSAQAALGTRELVQVAGQLLLLLLWTVLVLLEVEVERVDVCQLAQQDDVRVCLDRLLVLGGGGPSCGGAVVVDVIVRARTGTVYEAHLLWLFPSLP